MEEFPDDETMRKISAEMNLSETAFVVPHHISERGKYHLRWFTPKVEVPLCGHATLATAMVLFEELKLGVDEIVFDTLSGMLKVNRTARGYIMDFPADKIVNFLPPIGFLESLGKVSVAGIGIGKMTKKVIVEVKNPKELTEVAPDFQTLLKSISIETVRGLIVTVAGYDGYDFASRYFAPWVGVNEDPVTGSAHTVLGPYWAQMTGRDSFKAYQASARGGELQVRVVGDRVELIAEAVIISSGNMFL